MSGKLKEWNIDNYLKTPEERQAFLDAAIAENDPQFLAVALGDIARAEGVAQVASRANLHRENIYRSFSQKGNPTLKSFLRLLDALNLQLSISPKM